MNLLMFNLAVDQEHVTLAFGLRWIEAIARRYDHVDIVTMRAGKYSLPSNVRVWSLGQEHGYSEFRRALRFYAIMWRIFRERSIGAVFTHMIPIFAILFWPVARIKGLRNVLWYAHGATPFTLRIAYRLVDRIVTSTPEGFRIASDKVVYLGQGIEDGIYKPVKRQAGPRPRVITVGRIAASKGIDLIVDAMADCGRRLNCYLVVVGAPTTDEEKAHADAVRRLADDKLGEDSFEFTGRKNAEEIASLLATCDVFVNLSATGSLDKAIVEAMASGCPVISSNDAFARLARDNGFSQCVIARNPRSLCEALSALLALPAAERQALADRQAAVAHRDHTLDGLIGRLCNIIDTEAAKAA